MTRAARIAFLEPQRSRDVSDHSVSNTACGNLRVAPSARSTTRVCILAGERAQVGATSAFAGQRRRGRGGGVLTQAEGETVAAPPST